VAVAMTSLVTTTRATTTNVRWVNNSTTSIAPATVLRSDLGITVETTGTELTATGTLASMLQAVSGTVMVELHQVWSHPGLNASISGNVVSGGAAHAVAMIATQGASAAKCTGVSCAPVGAGGMMGLARIAIAWDAGGTYFVTNGGKVFTGAALASMAGNPVYLLAGTLGYIRRIYVWDEKKTETEIQEMTGLNANNFANSPNALNLWGRTVTMDEQWTQFGLGSNVRSIGTAAPTDELYNAAVGYWKPYSTYYDAAHQTPHGTSNNEQYEWNANYEHADWVAQGYSPFSVVANDAGDTSSLRIRAQKVSTLGAGIQTIVNSTLPKDARGASFAYLGGILTTHQNPEGTGTGFSQAYGYWECRSKFPARADAVWPAIWGMFGNSWPPEVDIMERFGTVTPDGGFLGTLHWGPVWWQRTKQAVDYFSVPDMATEYHTIGVLWRTGTHAFDYYVDGKYVFTIDPSWHADANFVGKRMFWLINLAIGESGWMPPTASTPTDTSFYIDYVRTWSA
jgi:hypothetical protein